jgi:HlyD family secretion protein
MLPRPPAPPEKKAGSEKKSGTQRIWVLKDGQAAPVDIVTGQTDGKRTQVTAGDLKPGDKVITDTVEAAKP